MHREHAHLKVPGFSIVLNALLTRKLPTVLSRLNEISGGCEKIAPVSGLKCTETSITYYKFSLLGSKLGGNGLK